MRYINFKNLKEASGKHSESEDEVKDESRDAQLKGLLPGGKAGAGDTNITQDQLQLLMQQIELNKAGGNSLDRQQRRELIEDMKTDLREYIT